MKILVAENEPEVLRLYRALLEDEGHEVTTAKDGIECVSVYRSALGNDVQEGKPPFDLVIIDHKMPNKTGAEAADEILALCPTQQVLIITAYGGELKMISNLDTVKIIRKPLDIDEFISSVRQFVRQ
jgi:two-component system cell cycle response regulator CpdR